MSVYDCLKIQRDGGLLYLALSRPEVKNSLSPGLIEELSAAFDSVEETDRAVLIRGEGDTFCSGIDLEWLKSGLGNSQEKNKAEALMLIDLFTKIRNCPLPVITLVKGTTLGAGIGIMLASDIIISESRARFGLSEVAIGVVPAAIVKEVTERAGITKSRELLLTGRRISADEALSCGLVNHVVPEEGTQKMVEAIMRMILNNGREAMKTVKEMLNSIMEMEKEERRHYMAETIALLRQREECQEGINAFFEKRPPIWRK